MVCNGTRPVEIKTIHGCFIFNVQKYKIGTEAKTYFSWTEQFRERYTSQRLEEFVTYYSNRLSYEEVAKLVARNQGEGILSDQCIWMIVQATAEQVSHQIHTQTNQTLSRTTFDRIKTRACHQLKELTKYP